MAGTLQAIERASIASRAETLIVWGKRSANIRTFRPLDANPIQIGEHRVNELGATTPLVQVVVPQKQRATRRLGPLLGDKEGAGVT